MSEILFKPYTILSADLGGNNPMADIKNVEYIHAGYQLTDRIKPGEKKHIGKGMISTILPYMLQDNYNRVRKPKDYNAVILENKHLRAVFLPELGGRLWSLYHKGLKKELLYKNSVFQPGNLGIRNAWFSGGVEWNACIKGHNPLTCSPLFAQKITYDDGSFGLRMYEHERIRDVVISIEAWLPEDSEMLYVRPRIENTSKEEKYMYWWSNIAVPESEGTRVIAPANESFICYYKEGSYVLDSDIYPNSLGTDASYPKNLKKSLDFFYKVPDSEEKWIATVEKDGTGLIQCSTKEQVGRKLFVWGRGKGGKNWNEFLSTEGEAYIEIQAGLARTQLEHIPMPGETVWEWVEAYGAAVCDPKEAHNSDWNISRKSVVSNFHKYFPNGIDRTLREEGKRKKTTSDEKILQMGSGWGYC